MKRIWICSLLFGLPQLICSLFSVEVWPFSNFPMYSRRLSSHETRLFIVTEDGRSWQMRSSRFLFPMDYANIGRKLHDIRSEPDSEKRIDEILDYYLSRALKIHREGRAFTASPPRRIEIRRETIARTPDCFNCAVASRLLYAKDAAPASP